MLTKEEARRWGGLRAGGRRTGPTSGCDELAKLLPRPLFSFRRQRRRQQVAGRSLAPINVSKAARCPAGGRRKGPKPKTKTKTSTCCPFADNETACLRPQPELRPLVGAAKWEEEENNQDFQVCHLIDLGASGARPSGAPATCCAALKPSRLSARATGWRRPAGGRAGGHERRRFA